ncbi:MAG: MBL fold metallo-hydrolase [Planctomycetes bacterium]|nr:MBL fold metallo-hydrolase [Planctomycetota bacterium]
MIRKRESVAILSIAFVVSAAWMAQSRSGDDNRNTGWTEVAPGILRTAGYPAGYALVEGKSALLIDAPRAAAELPGHTTERVLLSHYHRGSCAAVAALLRKGINVRAPKGAAEWLSVEGARKYWRESLPLRGSRTAYQVVADGDDGIDCSLIDGEKIAWRGWDIEVLSAPGHALAHVAFLVRKGRAGQANLFCGGALAAPGKLWAPYTTDWDHWTDLGLKPAAESLRKLAARRPERILPAHGPVIDKEPVAALLKTAEAVEEVGFLRSFERFTKKRLGNAPSYKFLVPEQAMSNGSKPWSRVSEHLFVTGNTYVLTSKDGASLMIDPWGQRSADQFAKLTRDEKLGPLEVVMFSHAHYDHYDGISYLPGRAKLEVWTLDRVATPIAEPFRWRAPFLDARPVKIDRRPKEGDTLTWREYRFRFCFLPGQSRFTMGVETEIDGKRCFLTADNFFHQDMFSGSGGWMGLNRSWPMPYAESAQKVLDARPDWVLAEHGGPFEFNAEDFRRRVEWGKAGARAADVISPSGNHRHDWDPNRVLVEPLVHKARPGDTIRATLVADNPLSATKKLTVHIDGFAKKWELEVPRGGSTRRAFEQRLPRDLATGRHVFPLRVLDGDRLDPVDAFVVVDVEADGR